MAFLAAVPVITETTGVDVVFFARGMLSIWCILASQETKLLRNPVAGPWPRQALGPCWDCHSVFHGIPAFIMVPSSHLGIYGNYCSWNCAKRALLKLRTRRWFSLMAITAIRTGAKLPIRISDENKECVPLYIPTTFTNFIYVSKVHIGPPPTLPQDMDEDKEPDAYNDLLPLLK